MQYTQYLQSPSSTIVMVVVLGPLILSGLITSTVMVNVSLPSLISSPNMVMFVQTASPTVVVFGMMIIWLDKDWKSRISTVQKDKVWYI